ncbi:hypothetical protein GCM10009654_26190 [Streptomyces hebeiensis]|uniref:Uncharacterized protein n=1 Tax=Streptomyces hebeiensis TaxID=229486 RepID=A0ABN1UUF4_9ACTN
MARPIPESAPVITATGDRDVPSFWSGSVVILALRPGSRERAGGPARPGMRMPNVPRITRARHRTGRSTGSRSRRAAPATGSGGRDGAR